MANYHMFFAKLWLFLAMLILAQSAFAQTANQPGANVQPVSPATYQIGPGDILEISVWKEPDMVKQVIVPPDGVIAFPHSGSINVSGKTIDDITSILVSRLEKIIIDPVVTVYLQNYASQKIFVVGKVNNPGVFAIAGAVDVMQALAMAGGMAQFADQDSIKILRRINGQPTSIPFDYADVANGKNLAQNILLEKGDVVVVP